MFLSKVELNPMRREARKLLGNPQAMHAVVMAACSGPATDAGRPLWRVDEDGDQVVLYVTSPVEPSFDELLEKAGWPNQPAQVAHYAPFLEKLSAGQEYAFRLTANPTHVVTEDGQKKRYGHVTVAHQQEWLLQRLDAIGFELRQSSLHTEGEPPPDLVLSHRLVRTFRRQGRPVTLTMCTYQGTLRVTDPVALRSALSLGIGRAKAYGCGLLTLARL